MVIKVVVGLASVSYADRHAPYHVVPVLSGRVDLVICQGDHRGRAVYLAVALSPQGGALGAESYLQFVKAHWKS